MQLLDWSLVHVHNHITSVLTTLHWLPLCKRVMFKTVVLVWRCLNGNATSLNSAFLLSLLRVVSMSGQPQQAYYKFPTMIGRTINNRKSLSLIHI